MKLGLKDRFSIVKGALYLILGICCVYLILTGRYPGVHGVYWKSHATLTLLAKHDCPLWLQYD